VDQLAERLAAQAVKRQVKEAELNKASRSNRYNTYLLNAIVLVTLAVFSQVLWHDFVNFDDPVLVTSNPHVLHGVTFDAIRWAFAPEYGSDWVPLTTVSHMLDVQLFGMNPSGHHFVSLLFHVASSALLFMLLERATKAPLKSAVVALLFALHPLQVESVAWIAERKDVLSAFFWMLAVYSYVLYSEKVGKLRYLVVFMFFALGLLSKPMVVTLPVVLLLLDWWPLGRSIPERAGNRSSFHRSMMLFVEKIPFLILSGCLSVVTYTIKQGQGEIVTEISWQERAARAFILYCEYIYKMIWPGKLAVYYPVSGAAPSTVSSVFALLAFLAVTCMVLLGRKRFPFLIMGWFWFVVALLPVIGLIQSGACIIADRYMYIPSIGLFVVLVWGGGRLTERWQSHKALIAAVLAIGLAGILIVTSIQLGYWKNSFTLHTHAIEVTDNNWLALNNLGQAYLTAGKIEDAIWYFTESVKANPSYVLALVNLGALYAAKNQPEQAVAILKRAAQFEPRNEKIHLILQSLQYSGIASASRLLNELGGTPFNNQTR
jgi:tetratricopeptide (TPR) repeat protein